MKMTKKDTDPMQSLIDAILGIRGKKIITLTHNQDTFTIDVDEDGVFGYDTTHEALFRAKLASAFQGSSVLIVRQFLSLRVERQEPDGSTIWIPKKNVYGIVIRGGAWYPVPRDELRKSYSIDAKTGKPIAVEPDILFAELPRGVIR